MFQKIRSVLVLVFTALHLLLSAPASAQNIYTRAVTDPPIITHTILDSTFDIVLVDATNPTLGPPLRVTLPNPAGANQGRHYTIKKVDASVNGVEIIPAGSNIDGQNRYFLLNQHQEVRVVSDGTNWRILDAQPKDVLHAHTFPGTDMGARINSARAVLAQTTGKGGKIVCPPGSHDFSTPIVINNNIDLECAGPGFSNVSQPSGTDIPLYGTLLNWNGGARVTAMISSLSRVKTPPVSVVTVTTTENHNFVAGWPVGITGVQDGSFNGKFRITAVLNNTFQYEQSFEKDVANSMGGTATARGAAITIVGSNVNAKLKGFALENTEITRAISAICRGTACSPVEPANTVRVTTGVSHNLVTGEQVTISGVTPSSFDGVFRVTVASATTFTYSNAGADVTGSNGNALKRGEVGIDVDEFANGVIIHDVVSRAEVSRPWTAAGVRLGEINAVVDMTLRDSQFRGHARGLQALNVSGHLVSDHSRFFNNTMNDVVLGDATATVASFKSYGSTYEAAPNVTSVLIQNVLGAAFLGDYWECDGISTWCVDIPSTAVAARGISIRGGYVVGTAFGNVSAEAFRVNHPAADFSVKDCYFNGFGTEANIAPTGAKRDAFGATVTITTTAPHGLAPGATVIIAGVNPSSFDGTFPVATVPATPTCGDPQAPRPCTFTYTQPGTQQQTGGGGTADVTGYIVRNEAAARVTLEDSRLDPNPGVLMQEATNYKNVITKGNVCGESPLPCSRARMIEPLALTAPNGQELQIASLTELTTINAAAFTDTAIQVPANAVVLAVSVRVTATIPTAASFDVGVAGATTRYGAGLLTAVNTTNPGSNDGTRFYVAPTSIRITPNMQPANNTGRVRVTIHYYLPVAPTS